MLDGHAYCFAGHLSPGLRGACDRGADVRDLGVRAPQTFKMDRVQGI